MTMENTLAYRIGVCIAIPTLLIVVGLWIGGTVGLFLSTRNDWLNYSMGILYFQSCPAAFGWIADKQMKNVSSMKNPPNNYRCRCKEAVLLTTRAAGTAGLFLSTKYDWLSYGMGFFYFWVHNYAFHWVVGNWNQNPSVSSMIRVAFDHCKDNAVILASLVAGPTVLFISTKYDWLNYSMGFLFMVVCVSVHNTRLERNDAVHNRLLRPASPVLQMDEKLLKEYFRLSPQMAQLITSKLPRVVVQHAKVDISHVTESESIRCAPKLRWFHFCQALGSIPTLQQVHVFIGAAWTQEQDAAFVTLLQNVRQISYLQLESYYTGVFITSNEIVEAFLQNQQALETLVLSLPVSTYQEILPIVRCLPLLKRIEFCPFVVQQIDEITAVAISSYFARCRSLDCVKFIGLKYANARAWSAFCGGIAQSHFGMLYLANFLPEDTAELAIALISSQVRQLKLSKASVHWADANVSRPTNILPTLSSSIPAMCLLVLDLHQLTVRPHESDLLSIIYAAVMCRSLLNLKLPIMQYSDCLDNALAHLLLSGPPNLGALTIVHPNILTDAARVGFPKLLRALRSNFTIKLIEWSRPDVLYQSETDPWCSSFKREVETVTRLNRHGREYLHNDTCNILKGMRLLEAVKDDLDCLFFQIREHPALCCRSSN